MASERLISCFTSASDGFEESWGGEKKGQESRNMLIWIHTVKVISLVFKTISSSYLTVLNHCWTCAFQAAKHLYMDLTSVSPHLAMSNSGQRFGQIVEMVPAGIHCSVVCLHIGFWSQLSQCLRKMCLIWCSITAGSSVAYAYSKSKFKIPMTLPLSWSVTDEAFTCLCGWSKSAITVQHHWKTLSLTWLSLSVAS